MKESKSHSVQSDKNSTALAARVELPASPKKTKIRSCNLCTADGIKSVNHPIYKCAKYPDAMSKVNRIKKASGCTKCGNLQHEISNCKFRLKNKCHLWSERKKGVCNLFEILFTH